MMAEDHLEILNSARKTLVALRRQLAGILATPYERGRTTEETLSRFIEVQRAIEAVDAALKDEQKPPSLPPTAPRRCEGIYDPVQVVNAGVFKTRRGAAGAVVSHLQAKAVSANSILPTTRGAATHDFLINRDADLARLHGRF